MPSRWSILTLVTLLLGAPALAGCLGLGDAATTDQPVQKQRANVDAQLGGIEGVVTDNAVQPVVGANVTLVEVNETVRTASDGSYAFSLVEPGTYTLSVKAGGFVSAAETTTVVAGEVAIADFLVTPLASEQPFVQSIEYAAFIECGTGVRTPVIAVTVATCAFPNAIMEELGQGGNATNDNFMQFIDLEPPIHTLVWEAQWDAGGNALGENLWLVAEIDGHVNSGDPNATVHRDLSASSPFRAQVNKTHWDAIADNFQTQCEEGDDSYCGYNFADRGWPLAVRTFTATDCTPTPVSACAPLQVKVDHVFTGFYNAPAPEGYSVFGGGA